MHTCILSHLANSPWCSFFEPRTDNFQGLGLKRCVHVTPSVTFYERLQSSIFILGLSRHCGSGRGQVKEKAHFVSHSLCIRFSFPVCCCWQRKDKASKNQTKIKTFIIYWFSIHIIPSNKNPNHFLNYQHVCIPSPWFLIFFRINTFSNFSFCSWFVISTFSLSMCEWNT